MIVIMGGASETCNGCSNYKLYMYCFPLNQKRITRNTLMLTNIGYPYMENDVNIRNDYQVECIHGIMNAPSKMVNLP